MKGSSDMGFVDWLTNTGTVFHAACPKCNALVEWVQCPNCGGSRFSLEALAGYGSRYFFQCTNCTKKYTSMTCTCECTVNASLFRRIK
jgi:hypothetical protein